MKLLKIFPLLLTLNCLVLSRILPVSEDSDLSNLTNHTWKIIKIFDKKLDSGYIGFISKDQSSFLDDIIKLINLNYKSKILVANYKENVTLYNPLQVKLMKQGNLKLLLIYVQAAIDSFAILGDIAKTPFYKTRCKVLIILQKTALKTDLEKMFLSFWSKKFINVVAIYVQNTSLLKYTYNPFDKTNLLKNLTSMKLENIFYNRFVNLNGHRLNILLVKYDDKAKIQLAKNPDGSLTYNGHEMDLLRCLLEKMNATYKVFPSAFVLEPGERNPWHNGNDLNYSGVASKLRILTQYSIDIMNSEEIVVRDNLEGLAESLYPHAFDDMRIIMKKKGQMPYYTYLFLVFKSNLWIGLFFVYLIGATVWRITSDSFRVDNIYYYINMIRVISGGSLPKISQRYSERTFLSFVLFFALVILTAFTSKLTIILMQNRYYPEYNTLEELQKDGVTLCAYKTQIVELQVAFNGTNKESLFRYMVPAPNKYNHINNSLNNYTDFFLNFVPKCPFFLNNERVMFIMRVKLFRPLFHIVKESPIPNYLAFRVSADSPLYDALNKNLRRIIEADLRKVWIQEHLHRELMTGYFIHPDNNKKDSTQTNPLSLYHLHAAFLILGTGLLVSFCMCIFELIYFKVKTRCKCKL